MARQALTRDDKRSKEEKSREKKRREEKILSSQAQDKLPSGVRHDEAFVGDTVNMYQRLGYHIFVQLATEFYDRVYADDNAWFKSVFAVVSKEEAIQKQYEFLIQQMGGPPLYSRRKEQLTCRFVKPYEVSKPAVEHWLQHMKDSLISVGSINADSKVRIWDFFRIWCAASVQCRSQFEFCFPFDNNAMRVENARGRSGIAILAAEIPPSKESVRARTDATVALVSDTLDKLKDSPDLLDLACKMLEEIIEEMYAINAHVLMLKAQVEGTETVYVK